MKTLLLLVLLVLALIYHWMRHAHVHLQVPDVALDKHNERGRRLGRGWKHFFDEGTQLQPLGSVPGEQLAKERAMSVVGSAEPSLFPSVEPVADAQR